MSEAQADAPLFPDAPPYPPEAPLANSEDVPMEAADAPVEASPVSGSGGPVGEMSRSVTPAPKPEGSTASKSDSDYEPGSDNPDADADDALVAPSTVPKPNVAMFTQGFGRTEDGLSRYVFPVCPHDPHDSPCGAARALAFPPLLWVAPVSKPCLRAHLVCVCGRSSPPPRCKWC